jgi:hypothetical protein
VKYARVLFLSTAVVSLVGCGSKETLVTSWFRFAAAVLLALAMTNVLVLVLELTTSALAAGYLNGALAGVEYVASVVCLIVALSTKS